MELLHISTVDELRNSHKKWVEEILKTKNYVRESKWSQSIAVGSKSFVEGIKEKRRTITYKFVNIIFANHKFAISCFIFLSLIRISS